MSEKDMIKITVELNDGVKVIEGFKAILAAMGKLDTAVNVLDGNVLEWDISKNAPGYSVKMRDEAVGGDRKFIVGKAKRVKVQTAP